LTSPTTAKRLQDKNLTTKNATPKKDMLKAILMQYSIYLATAV